MSNVAYIDPRDPAPALANLDAEQGILGAALYDNQVVAQLDGLDASHFAEPVHGRIWLEIVEACAGSGVADPTLLAQRMKEDGALKTLGGVVFLASLVDHAPATRVAEQYAKLVTDLAGARGLIRVADEATAAVRRGEPAAATIAGLESALLALRSGGDRAELVSAAEAAGGVAGHTNFFVWLDDMLAGVLVYSPVKYRNRPGKSAIYLLSDMAVTAEGRLSKLIVRLAVCKVIIREVEARLLNPINFVETTAFSEHPISMKYRGIFDLISRRDAAPPMHGHQLQYGADVIDETPEEAFSWWWRNHGDPNRQAKPAGAGRGRGRQLAAARN